jgi:hypothetical protein
MSHIFGAEDILSALGITGSCSVQESGNDTQTEHASVEDKGGNVIGDTIQEMNEKDEMSISIKADASIGNVTFSLGGIGTDGVVITQADVGYVNNDYPTLRVTAHKHPVGSHLANNSDPANNWDVTIPLTFGIQKVHLGGTLADCQKCDVSLSCEHVDKQNNEGDHLTGNSYGFRAECTEEYITDTKPTIPAGWNGSSNAKQSQNKDFYAVTARAWRADVPTLTTA